LDYANRKQIPFAIIIGDDEINRQKVSLKDLQSGTQETVDLFEAVAKLR
jgi:histidyl-tRNA synthetase